MAAREVGEELNGAAQQAQEPPAGFGCGAYGKQKKGFIPYGELCKQSESVGQQTKGQGAQHTRAGILRQWLPKEAGMRKRGVVFHGISLR